MFTCISTLVVIEHMLSSMHAQREFCRAIIAHESSLLRLDHLQPHDLVSLYHMSHVLHSLVHYSRALLDLIHTHFAEEFK